MDDDGESDGDERPLREQLLEACERVRRQIELEGRSSGVARYNPNSLAATTMRELWDELAQLEDALANLEPGET